MPRLPFAPLVAALITACPCPAAEKPPAFDDVIRHTPAGMTTETAVQEELKMTDDQKAAVAKAVAAEGEAFAAGWKKLGDQPTADATGKLVADARAAANEVMGKVLTEGQAKRLRQLDLQARGPAAFDDPEVQKALGGVTDEQRKKWAAAKDEYERKLAKLKREAGGVTTVKTIPGTDIPAAGQEVLGDQKTVTMLKKEHWLASKNVLTNDQLTKWYDLIGDIFPNPTKPKK